LNLSTERRWLGPEFRWKGHAMWWRGLIYLTVGAFEMVAMVQKRWCSTKMTSTQPIITEPYVPLKEAEEVLTHITSVERKKKALKSFIAA
jgi:hypothetical protein